MPPPIRATAAYGVAYRTMSDSDLPFSAALYATTRADEMAMFGWPEPMQRAFVEQQHIAQHRHFRAVYPAAEWLIVERDGQPIGRLYIDSSGESLHLIDIALVPECRGAGLGGAILTDLIAQARALGKAVSLRVETRNPAARLYLRLGFQPVGDDQPYQLMVLTAGSESQTKIAS